MRRWAATMALVAAAAWPATAQAPRTISAADRQQGAQAHPQLLQDYGGAYDGPQASYVRRVGQRIAAQSGLANPQEFTITLLNSPVNNAFAIPGGYVYVTRQLMALANDEAELAFVMGHEVGHVAARHAAKRNTTSTIGNIGALLVGVLTGSSGLAQAVGQGAQLYTLRFSRSQEFEADDLGVQYLTRAGYDPYAGARLLNSLAASDALEAQTGNRPARSTPSWASTHPDPASRVARAAERARQSGLERGELGRNAYLAAVDGLLYGDDPRQGVVEGSRFRHPVLRLGFDAPPGFALQNGTGAVTIAGDGGKAQFSGARFDGDLVRYVARVFAAVGAPAPGQVARTRVNGMAAAYATVSTRTDSGPVDVSVFAYEYAPGQVYHFVMLTASGSGIGPFAPLVGSFRRLSPAEAAGIRARRVRVYTVRPGDTAQAIAARMAFADYRYERFAVLNALRPGQALVPGARVKLIVFE